MRIAIITGASSGIGREFALVVDAKYDLDCIWLVARREDRLKETASLMQTPTEIIPVDLALEMSLDMLREKIDKEKPQIQILVNAAGFGKFGTVASQSIEDVKKMIDVNIKALTTITRLCIPYMSDNGAILNMASASAFVSLPYFNIYSATKTYVLHFSEALANELKESRISVTAVCPYWVSTEFIPVAQHTPQGDSVNNFMFITYPFSVVKKALNDNRNGNVHSFIGFVPRVIKLLSRTLPEKWHMPIWNDIRHINSQKYSQQFPEQLPLI